MALAHGVPIVPVLVGGVDVPPPKRLPKELRGIKPWQAIPLRSAPDFHSDLDRLIAHLRQAGIQNAQHAAWFCLVIRRRRRGREETTGG